MEASLKFNNSKNFDFLAFMTASQFEFVEIVQTASENFVLIPNSCIIASIDK